LCLRPADSEENKRVTFKKEKFFALLKFKNNMGFENTKIILLKKN